MYVECNWNTAKVEPQMAPRIAWKKMTSDQIYTKYTLLLQDELFTVNQILDRNGECHFKSRKEEVEQLIKAVIGSMLRVSKLNLPYTKFNKHITPYWRYNKDTLNETHAMKEQVFYK